MSNEKNFANEKTIYEIDKLDKSIFPLGVQKYNVPSPVNYKPYLYPEEIKCPVCEAKSTMNTLLIAHLPVIETDKFLRRHYKDFDPLWYNIWVCPSCYYSDYHHEFDKVEAYYLKNATPKLKEFRKDYCFNFSEPRTFDEVLASYFMALYSANLFEVDPVKKARIWLHISWLYTDAGDTENFEYACAKSLEFYEHMYYGTVKELEPKKEQATALIMAELNIVKKDYDKAMTHLMAAKKTEGGTRLYSIKADSRMEDVRQMKKAVKK